jgi:acyl carrier protein
MSDLESELKRLIVKALILEDVKAEEIDTDAPLFGEGLGLDSIDALELGMALSREYGIEIKSEDTRNRDRFRSGRTLAEFVRSEMEQFEAGDV